MKSTAGRIRSPVLAAFGDHPLGLLDPLGAECSRVCPRGPDLRRLAQENCRRRAQRPPSSAPCQRPAPTRSRSVPRPIMASRSSSLSILMPLKTTSWGQQHSWALELRSHIGPQRHPLHGRRHDRARRIEAAGRQRFIDVHGARSFRQIGWQNRDNGPASLGRSVGLTFQSTRSIS